VVKELPPKPAMPKQEEEVAVVPEMGRDGGCGGHEHHQRRVAHYSEIKEGDNVDHRHTHLKPILRACSVAVCSVATRLTRG